MTSILHHCQSRNTCPLLMNINFQSRFSTQWNTPCITKYNSDMSGGRYTLSDSAGAITVWSRCWVGCTRWGAHWRNLANKIEPSLCGGDAALMSNYFDHLLQQWRRWHAIGRIRMSVSTEFAFRIRCTPKKWWWAARILRSYTNGVVQVARLIYRQTPTAKNTSHWVFCNFAK